MPSLGTCRSQLNLSNVELRFLKKYLLPFPFFLAPPAAVGSTAVGLGGGELRILPD